MAPLDYFFAYFIFFSALIVSIRSDLETMLLSRWVTLYILPLGFLFSHLAMLPISLAESVLGAALGYGILLLFAKLFLWLTQKQGMGQGDLELLAFIGAFTGPIGIWVTLIIGSWIGSIISLAYLWITKKDRSAKIPFGPFLALGALSYVLLQDTIADWFLLLPN